MRIAVVGGGICGLTCAIGLMKAGADVHVYEAAVSDRSIRSAPFEIIPIMSMNRQNLVKSVLELRSVS